MKLKAVLPLILALVVGAVTVQMGRGLLNKKSTSADPVKSEKVLVAAVDLPLGQELRKQDLTWIDAPVELLPAGRIKTAEEAIGRVLATPLAKGQMLVDTLLAPEGTAAGLQAAIPKGMRAVTIEVNEVTGLAGLITRGSRVDVVTTLMDNRTRMPVSRAIVQNVPVTAVGGNMDPGADGKGPAGATKAKTVTLIVTPEQAEALDLAYTKSRPRLVLRSADDEPTEPSRGVTLSQLVSGRLLDEQVVSDSIEKVLERLMAARAPAVPVAAAAVQTAPATQPLGVATTPETESENSRWMLRVIRGGVESVEEFDDPSAKSPGAGEVKPGKSTPPIDPFSSAN